MRRFQYFEPKSLDDAVSLLATHHPQASILAGGTDLLVEIKEQLRRTGYVINIKKIPGLDDLAFDEQHGLKIGALATVRDVELMPAIIRHYAGLAQAALELGSIQVRNRATIAGNICRASPSADTLPPLIADGATLRLRGQQGERELSMEAFFTGPGQTVLQTAEILLEIRVPPPLPETGKVYIKHGRRRAMELATVGVAVSLTFKQEVISQIRIVLGAVAPTPIRALEAEDLLLDQPLDEQLLLNAAEAAGERSRPISDVRSSAAYRKEMVRVLTLRALRMAAIRAREDSRS